MQFLWRWIASTQPSEVTSMTLEEAVTDALITGLEATLKKMKEIRETWQQLPEPVKQEITSGVNPVDQIKTKFPPDLAELLTFEPKEDAVIIKPRQFLGSESFAKIAAIIRNLGGEYVSAGRDSHFRIKGKTL